MSHDPYKYFRIEAREILDELVPRALRLEQAGAEEALQMVEQMMRSAHTLKGAAGVVGLEEIARRAHVIEDQLDEARRGGRGTAVEQILALTDEIDAHLRRLGSAAKDSAGSVDAASTSRTDDEDIAAADARAEVVRVGIREFDELSAGLVQTGVEVAGMEHDVTNLRRADRLLRQLESQLDASAREDGYGLSREQLLRRNRQLIEQLRSTLSATRHELSDRARRISRELEDLRDLTTHLRLVPAARLETMLERAVRDAANACGKEAALRFVGAQVRLDAQVVARVGEALLHLVRNAVAHGIEPPQQRQRHGKPTVGQVDVHVERRGDRVHITCSDDGAGIDTAAVGHRAAAQGILPPEQARELATERAVALLLSHPRLSTSTHVDSVSGRGLGLTIVSQAVAALQGQVAIHTVPAGGTKVELVVPVSTAWMKVLRLHGDRHEAAIPLERVVGVQNVTRHDLVESAQGVEFEFDGQTVPFGLIDDLMSRGRTTGALRETWTVAVVDSGAGRVALGGAGVRGISQVVVRPIPAGASVDEVVSGAFLDEAGQPQLVVDPTAAARALGSTHRPSFASAAPARSAHLLAIDDSMTTRMLLQSILETAGYHVTLASSAEEGMALATEAHFDVFLVDVEMPGINGFEFVERTRQDPGLGDIPAILITSRNDAEDRRRGREAGASAYIVKGEFDQGDLLETIEGLLARRRDDERAEVRRG